MVTQSGQGEQMGAGEQQDARQGPGQKTPRWTHEMLMNMDRRFIFVVIAIAVAAPLIFPLNLPVRSSREAEAYFNEMEKLQPGDEIIFSFDYEPDTMAELDPMSVATLRHAFRKDVRVLAQTTYAGGVGIAERILRQVAQEYDKVYGEDYVFFGYNPDYSATILRMGESIRSNYPTDHYHAPTDGIPLMKGVDCYDDIELLVTVTASALAEYWIIWAGGKYKQRIIAGNTAIQAVLIYPYYQAGQLAGFLGGLKGAAEYEKLIGVSGAGLLGMDAQSVAHLAIVCFIILGNIGFLIQKSRTKQTGGPRDSRQGG
ncbi:MAG: hypothetical protein KAY24_03590 [Candidatus Eisenbacteria sp.]|nr:hypothetical protein [Candidatus Eisenbacteria bacterium]